MRKRLGHRSLIASEVSLLSMVRTAGTVLIGGAGGVGVVAVRLAKLAGARMIGLDIHAAMKARLPPLHRGWRRPA